MPIRTPGSGLPSPLCTPSHLDKHTFPAAFVGRAEPGTRTANCVEQGCAAGWGCEGAGTGGTVSSHSSPAPPQGSRAVPSSSSSQEGIPQMNVGLLKGHLKEACDGWSDPQGTSPEPQGEGEPRVSTSALTHQASETRLHPRTPDGRTAQRGWGTCLKSHSAWTRDREGPEPDFAPAHSHLGFSVPTHLLQGRVSLQHSLPSLG